MYGDDEGVAAFTPRFANESGRFDNVTVPTLSQVLEWMTQISAMLDISLATAGLPAPSTSATVVSMLDGFVNANTSGLVRAVNGQGRYAEKPSAVDEMLLSIQSAADLWVDHTPSVSARCRASTPARASAAARGHVFRRGKANTPAMPIAQRSMRLDSFQFNRHRAERGREQATHGRGDGTKANE
jgi:hypothetical protein